MRRLLQFLVAESLAGRGADVKAYSVAVDGLGKNADFDPQADSYPRVQVGRLRRMLEQFYAEYGSSPYGVRLSIPSGSYQVRWAFDPAAEVMEPRTDVMEHVTPEPSRRPDQSDRMNKRRALVFVLIPTLILLVALVSWSILRRPQPSASPVVTKAPVGETLVPPPILDLEKVVPVEEADPALSGRVDRVLGDALHRTWVFKVRRAASGDATDKEPQANYRLTGTLVGSDLKLLYLSLWDGKGTTQIWSRRLDLSKSGSAWEALGPTINALMSPLGIIGSRERKATAGNFSPGFPCMMRYAEYYLDNASTLARPVATCLERTLQQDPGYVPALASQILIGLRQAQNDPERAAAARNNALILARRALDADPYSADASMAMAMAAYNNNMCDLGRASAAEGLDRNPFDGYAHARAGLYMFQCGDRGYEAVLRRAWTLDNTLPAITAMPILVSMDERGEGKAALRFALGIPVGEGFRKAPYEATMAVAYAAAGDRDSARAHWMQVTRMVDPKASPTEILQRILILPKLAERTVRYLRDKGVITE